MFFHNVHTQLLSIVEKVFNNTKSTTVTLIKSYLTFNVKLAYIPIYGIQQ